MAIHLYYSASMYPLCDALAENLAQAAGDPLERPVVFAPNPYLMEWVKMRLADDLGVTAGIDFRFLEAGLWQIISDMQKNRGIQGVLLDEDLLRLFIHHELTRPGGAGETEAPFASYLGAAGQEALTEIKAWGLAGRLASLFSAYETRRPAMIESWLSGRLVLGSEMEKAQRALYLSLAGPRGSCETALKGAATLAGHAGDLDMDRAALLPPLHFFCESQLSPFHAKLIFTLGQATAVFLYQMNPCSEFWEDLETPAEERWRAIRSVRLGENDQGEFLDSPPDENRLLQAWGRAGREDVKLLSMIEEASAGEMNFQAAWLDPLASPRSDTVLGQVHQRILKRISHGPVLPQDRSLQVASCPTLFREVESVYHSILHNLEEDPGLAMTDIAVFVPDMGLYGPVIQSIFTREQRIAFSMIDASADRESSVGAAVTSLLELTRGEFTRSQVFSLVMNPLFQRARGIDPRTAQTWLAWADRLNIFRGFDARSGTDGASSWLQGLRRLRRGRIMEPALDVHRDYRGVVPNADMNSSDREQISAMSETMEFLRSQLAPFTAGPMAAEQWRQIVEGLIEKFIAIPRDMPAEEEVLRSLRAWLARLEIFDNAPQPRLFSSDFIRQYLADGISAIPRSQGRYLITGVNVSALVPRRQIPFKVCYVLGMGEGPFPGAAEGTSLDLMLSRRRIGDVSRPDANRYLFLQIVMSTEEKLYLSYISRDLQKDQEFAPNSLVRQLLSHIEEHVIQDTFRLIEVPLRSHDFSSLLRGEDTPWQDFISHFNAGRPVVVGPGMPDRALFLKSLGKDGVRCNRNAETLLSSAMAQGIPDFSPTPGARRLPAVADAREKTALDLADLARFLSNPAEFLLARQFKLGRNLIDRDPLTDDDAPFFSEYPRDFLLVQAALTDYVLTGDRNRSLERLASDHDFLSLQGGSPGGAFGRVDLAALADRALGRIRGEKPGSGLQAFVQGAASARLIGSVSFGTVHADQGQVRLGAAACSLSPDSGDATLELSGSLPLLWKEPGGRGSFSLALSGASEVRPRHVVEPFLFYVIAASGLCADLCALAGQGPFTLYVELKEKIASQRWDLTEDEARRYLVSLLQDIGAIRDADNIPIEIALHKKMQPPHELELTRTGDRTGAAYRRDFMRILEEELDNPDSGYSESEMLSLVSPRVPHDVRDKVAGRFALMTRLTADSGGGDE
jgi:exonuclease V gamma subunit